MKMLRLISILVLAATLAQASIENIVTAVYSRTYNGYKRAKAADGSFSLEYYALANGSYLPGVAADASIDNVKFPQIAALTAQLLALRNYHLAPDAKQAAFLLVITWGKTIPLNDDVSRDRTGEFLTATNDLMTKRSGQTPYDVAPDRPGQIPAGRFNSAAAPVERGKDGIITDNKKLLNLQAESDAGEALTQLSMADDMRRQANQYNAQLLGYIEEINQRNNSTQFGGAGTAFHELIEDIENERYFFVISAYDFATAAKKGEKKLLWATRVSVQAKGNKFNEAAPLMLAKAAKYFGQDSGRLIRQFDPGGKVRLGDLKILGVVHDPRPSPPPEEKK